MPTYRIKFTDSKNDLVLEAADFKVKDEVLELYDREDRHIVAIVPLAKLMYVVEEKVRQP